MNYEQALLSAFITYESAYDTCKDLINDDAIFDTSEARELYAYIVKNNGKFEPSVAMMDLPMLKGYIKELMFVDAIDPEIGAKKLVEQAAKRELKNAIVESQMTDDPFESLAAIQRGADTVNNLLNYGVTSTGHIKELIDAELLSMDKASKQKGLIGIPSGFTALDNIVGGWQNSDLVIVAGRPAMGKTAFMLSIARAANVNVGIASLEMSKSQLTKRIISSTTEINMAKIKDPRLLDTDDWRELFNKTANEQGIYITDTAALNVNTFRSWAKKMHKDHNCRLFIVDYLQLMKADAKNREQEISTISRTLKQIAKELDCPVVSLAQLNRKVEERADKRPNLGDLRESGAIEQDADIVSFLYRPAYYGLPPQPGDPIDERYAEIIIAKHRNGSTGIVPMTFMGEYIKFIDPTKALQGHDEGVPF